MARTYIGILVAVLVVVAGFVACSSDPDTPSAPASPASPVVFDLNAVPYDSLSRYHFFSGDMADLDPVQGVLPYDVITPLFADFALKKRFIWMPEGVTSRYVGDGVSLDFDDGAVLIDNVYYDNVQPSGTRRIIETRLMIRKYGEWHAVSYLWNEQQTEAVLQTEGSFLPISWLDEEGDLRSVNFRVPAAAECYTCHRQQDMVVAIGPKPQNLDRTMTYAGGEMGQLQKWMQMGYLEGPLPASIDRVARWDDPSAGLQDRVRAYLDMNCSHCHSENGHCNYRPMRFGWSETVDPVNLGICVEPDQPLLPQHTHIVAAGNTERSLLYYRITSTEEGVRMPLLGRSLVHEDAVQLIGDWILSRSPPCP